MLSNELMNIIHEFNPHHRELFKPVLADIIFKNRVSKPSYIKFEFENILNFVFAILIFHLKFAFIYKLFNVATVKITLFSVFNYH